MAAPTLDLAAHQESSCQRRAVHTWRIDTIAVPEDARPYFGADWGFSIDPTVLVRCYIIGNTLYIDKEAYQVGCEIERTPALFETVAGARAWPITADSARPDTISFMRSKGFNISAARKGPGSVQEGVEFLKSYDIVVHPDCQHTIDELTLYSYKTDKLTDEVLPILEDRNNQTIDSLRYAVEGVRRWSPVYGHQFHFICDPIRLPSVWRRVFACDFDHQQFAAVWGAVDQSTDTVYLYDEYLASRAELAVHAEAIRRRGGWIPGLIDVRARGRTQAEGARVATHLVELWLDLSNSNVQPEEGVSVVAERLSSASLRVFRTMELWLAAYRRYQRDEKGELIGQSDHLMRATALVALYGADVAMTERRATSEVEAALDGR